MSEPTVIKDTTANPAPLGLMGFGMTTVLLNLHNAGLISLSSMILGMGLCYGGLAQVIAGIMEWKKQNTFGTLAFTSYGLFWISLVVMLVLPKFGWAAAPDKASVGAYLLVWGCFTFLMFFGTLRSNMALITVFGSLTILFLLLAAGDLSGNQTVTRIAGWEGIFVGLSAIYLGIAQVLNESYGRVVLPVGPRA
jgi:succinate-acetate transporter protein